jgi:hypothetical protein
MTKPATATSELAPTSARSPMSGKRAERDRGAAPAPAGSAPRTTLALAALGWLVLTLMLSRASLVGGGDTFNPALAAVALPMLVQASLIAGAAVGLWAVGLLAARVEIFDHGVRRVLAGLVAGLLTGALGSGVVLIAYGVPAAAAVILALAMGVAGAAGGAISSIRATPVLTAAVTASLVTMIVMYLTSYFNEPLLGFFGADGTAAGRYSANGLLAGATALTAGLVAGALAFWRLRRSVAQSGDRLDWPSYLLAGGGAGLMLIIAELFIRLGVPQLLSLTSTDVTGDQLWQSLAAGSRLNTGMVVFFVGAITAIAGYGRTLPKKKAD